MNTTKTILQTLNQIEIRKLVYAIPIVSILHELEEWNVLEWHLKVNTAVPIVTDLHVRIALVLVTLLHFVWVSISLIPKSRKVMYYILIPLLALDIENGFQHLIWLVHFGIYAPGFLFGCCLGIPVLFYILGRMIRDNLVAAWYYVAFSCVAGVGVILTVLRGDEIDPAVANAMTLGRSLSLWALGQ